MDIERLKAQIRQAFPPSPFNGPITKCDCEECTHLRAELRNKAWNELSNEFLDFTGSTALLTPEAFQAFVAAYLRRALDDLSWDNGHVVSNMISNLCPSEGAEIYLQARAHLVSPERRRAVRAFLAFVSENADDGQYWAPLIASALKTVWRSD